MVLCDFFPLYEYQTDVCAPTIDAIERRRRVTNMANDESASDPTLSSDYNQSTKRVEYGFQRHNRPAVTEIILMVWVFTLVCEEIRQVRNNSDSGSSYSLSMLLVVVFHRSTVDSKCSVSVFSSLLEQTRRSGNHIILRGHDAPIYSGDDQRVFLCGTDRDVSGLGYLVHAFIGYIRCGETTRPETSDDW